MSGLIDLEAPPPRDGLTIVREFVAAAGAAKDMVELRALVDDACAELGFD